MKKTVSILIFFLTGVTTFSQGRVANKIAELQSEKARFKKCAVLTPVVKTPEDYRSRTINGAYSLAEIKEEAVNDIVARKDNTIELEIPYQEEIITLQLYRHELFLDGFHIDTDQSKNVFYEPGVYYRGIIKGDPHSIASINFFKGEFNGIVSSAKIGNLVIGKQIERPVGKDSRKKYVIYEDQKMNIPDSFICGTIDENSEDDKIMSRTSSSDATEKCVAVYFEVDYDLYRVEPEEEKSVTRTTNWMTSVFNNVQTLFANDGIKIAIKSIFIWTNFDPYQYVGINSGAYLHKFRQVRPVFDGDIAQLIGADGGLGGLAGAVGGLCSKYARYCYADVGYEYNNVPVFSKTVYVITHELGHLLGSPHTHACRWNGNYTAIDNCGSGWNSGEGLECETDPPTLPSSSVKGTIMSYCDKLSSVGISFANGFGPQPAARIRQYINSKRCLSTDCVNTCVNTISELHTTRGEDGITETISWTDIGSNSSWQIKISPFRQLSGEYVTVTTNSYNATLLPNTYYTVKIKPTCAEGIEPMVEEYIILTSADYCEGIQLTDTGGISGYYSYEEVFVRTLIPSVGNSKLKLTFAEFALGRNDFLYIYDGSSTAAPLVGGAGLTGTTLPAPIESTAVDGALTLKFVSRGMEAKSGWIATTSCTGILGVDDATYIDYSYHPNPVNGFVTITSKDAITEIQVFNVQGQLLYNSQLNDLATKVDMTAYATGTYLFKMKINNQTVTFKVVKL